MFFLRLPAAGAAACPALLLPCCFFFLRKTPKSWARCVSLARKRWQAAKSAEPFYCSAAKEEKSAGSLPHGFLWWCWGDRTGMKWFREGPKRSRHRSVPRHAGPRGAAGLRRRCPGLVSPAPRGRLKGRASVWSPWGLVAQPGAALEAVEKGKKRLCASSRGGCRRLWGSTKLVLTPRGSSFAGSGRRAHEHPRFASFRLFPSFSCCCCR